MRTMRSLLVLLALGGTAGADTFGGFSGVDRPYQVNQDKVCTPLVVTKGAASGMPACDKANADVMAKLRFKEPLPQKGIAKPTFAATASGRTLTITRAATETPIVTWDAPDPIGKIVEVYGSQYDDRVAVAYTTRRMGKEFTDIVAFDLQKDGGTKPPPGDPNGTIVTPPPTTTQPTPPVDPKVQKAVDAAKKAAKGAKAIAAWKAVLALDAQHSEALLQLAAQQAQAKQPAEAMATLGTLAASTRADAIEMLIEARFDPAFASLRAEPAFRAKVGLDRKPGGTVTAYERLMSFGGQWEQTATSCDKPEVRFTATRDRVVRIRVKSRCEGMAYDLPFKGTWRIEGDRVVITMPTKGKQVTQADEAGCGFETQGDEDALRCNLGRDIEFVVLPTRR